MSIKKRPGTSRIPRREFAAMVAYNADVPIEKAKEFLLYLEEEILEIFKEEEYIHFSFGSFEGLTRPPLIYVGHGTKEGVVIRTPPIKGWPQFRPSRQALDCYKEEVPEDFSLSPNPPSLPDTEEVSPEEFNNYLNRIRALKENL